MRAVDKAREDWLIAIRAPQLGARRLHAGLLKHGSISAIRQAARRGDSGFPASSEAYLRQPDEKLLNQDLTWLAQAGHHLIAWGDADYPAQLADAVGAPAHLFVVGDPGVLWQAQIAIVGSRRASQNGAWQADKFSSELAARGFVITSGLAQGIDACAHRAALKVGGRTIAVLGTGPDLVYPTSHHRLSADIARHGALVSEWPPGTQARPGHFPVRNRIVSGLALGVVVVEASERSGSLITARLAAEQGREVMAVPGPAHHPQSRGCHQLIREGARLVDCAADIVEDVRPLAGRLAVHLRQALAPTVVSLEPAQKDKCTTNLNSCDLPEDLTQEQRQVLQMLDPLGLLRPLAVDEIVEATDLTAEAVSSMLLLLELKGLVASHAGGTWSRQREMNL